MKVKVRYTIENNVFNNEVELLETHKHFNIYGSKKSEYFYITDKENNVLAGITKDDSGNLELE